MTLTPMPTTPDALRLYQAAHRNHLGQPLAVDGILGPQTRWAMDFDTIAPSRRDVITRAQAYLGLTEDPPGSNDDPQKLIRTWLARAGAVQGDPWCAAFASHCLSAGPTLVRCAGAVALGKLFPETDEPRTGDIFWYRTQGAFHGHVGLVLGVSGAEVMTLEGNCGNAVRCVRRESAGLRFSRTLQDTSGKVPGVIASTPPAPGGTR